MNKTQHRAMVGRNLKQIADIIEREKGINNKKLAESIDADPYVFSNWLRGQNMPSELSIYQMHRKYGVTADWVYLGIASGLPHWIAQRIKHEADDDSHSR